MAPRQGASPSAILGSRTNLLTTRCASARRRVSKSQLLRAARRQRANFKMGPWLKSEAPALQAAISGSVTHRTPPAFAHNFNCEQRLSSIALAKEDLTFFASYGWRAILLRETRPKHRAKPHKLL